ncbi:taurine ABC transporter substrate-binding protein [Variovorax fucosicus]|uniref:taurine ABC transporter substrate-binding protein n=1 Tax=Variovorax fucosicus TaxID=3053517 RepID=UPI0025776BC6|nr:taurine ABC transporter substrate-binding protein [Variovorax sp. J22G47]MDM0059092.1 taurine ABC transporter substrate-binding protein [Variovorax sp. J22G47]
MIQRSALYALLAGAAFAFGLPAQAVEFTVGYQTVPTPSQVPQADGAYEKATNAKINWRKFDGGAEVINAVASGDVQIAYLGSSPLAAAASRKLPIETFLIAAELGTSEELVVRNGSGIVKPQDLVGKKIAVPFVSTGHYSLLAALKHWKIDPKKVEIVNLSPPNIIAAWARGDIDGTYVWDPALGKAKESGKVLITSGELSKLGAPTFDAWLVRKDFAEKNPAVVAAFAKVTLDSFAAYNKDPKAWAANRTNIDKIVKITGAKAEEIPGVLAGSGYLSPDDQARTLGEPTAKALANTSAFLKEQGRIDAPLPSYAPYTNAKYVKAANSL